MEKPIRKPNRLRDYDYGQNGAYFVTICVHNRKPILSTIVGDGSPVPKICGNIVEEMIHKITKRFPGVNIDKYMIMPDHIHMLISIDNEGTGNPSPTIGNIIGWFKYQTTKRINLLHNTMGNRIFQRSYYDHVIRNQQDYNEIWEYIANNPSKWMMIHNL